MRKRKHNAIFFDDGKRWRKIKKASAFGLVFAALIFFAVLYVFLSTPFAINFDRGKKHAIDEQIEEINSISRPIINQGTFLTMEDVYGKPYIKRFGEEKKLVILTFDDGPDPTFTPKILKILEQERVKGTFFVIGNQIYKYPEIGKRILWQGSDMGLHTFSHYENRRDETLRNITFIKELDFTEKLFAHYYGYKTRLFRIPYLGLEEHLSYNSLQYIKEAYKRGLTISAPTVDAEDWNMNHDANKIALLATESDVQTVVILFHDGGGNRQATVDALPKVISFYRTRGYRFSTISEYAKYYHLPVREPLTVPDKILSAASYYLYDAYKQSPKLFDKGFIAGFAFVLFHMSIFVILAIIEVIRNKRRLLEEKRKKKIPFSKRNYLVSVIVPMYNEERVILPTIRAILRSSYKNLEVLIIDDGSTDKSIKRVRKTIKDPRVRLFTQSNGGKFSALNLGLRHARGKIAVSIDADTRVKTSAIRRIINHFTNSTVAAVAGNVRIGNRKNLLAKLQSIEYTLAQSIEKRAFSLFGQVMIVPGAFGAWRMSSVRRIGGFSPQTHAEDFDLTLSLIKRGYEVRFSDNAIAYTEAPLTLSQLYMQRYRWNFGNLQVLFKNRDMLFRRNYGVLGIFFLPRVILVQIPSLLLTPLVDLFIVTNLLFGERTLTLFFFSFYLLSHTVVVYIAYSIMKQLSKDIVFVPLLRFPYSQFMYTLFYLTVIQALRGEIISWTKLTHSGKLSVANN